MCFALLFLCPSTFLATVPIISVPVPHPRGRTDLELVTVTELFAHLLARSFLIARRCRNDVPPQMPGSFPAMAKLRQVTFTGHSSQTFSRRCVGLTVPSLVRTYRPLGGNQMYSGAVSPRHAALSLQSLSATTLPFLRMFL